MKDKTLDYVIHNNTNIVCEIILFMYVYVGLFGL